MPYMTHALLILRKLRLECWLTMSICHILLEVAYLAVKCADATHHLSDTSHQVQHLLRLPSGALVEHLGTHCGLIALAPCRHRTELSSHFCCLHVVRVQLICSI